MPRFNRYDNGIRRGVSPALGGASGLPVLLLSLLLHASLLTWYAVYQRAPVTGAYAAAMSIQLVNTKPRKPLRPQQQPAHRGSPSASRDPIVHTPGPPVEARAAGMPSPDALAAAPFADGRRRSHLDLKLTRPCDTFGDGQPPSIRPCVSTGPLPRFDLNLERGGREFAFQTNRRGAMQRYREAREDESYPGLNCAIFQLKAFHLCKTHRVDTPPE
jgi:hypothetical protein